MDAFALARSKVQHVYLRVGVCIIGVRRVAIDPFEREKIYIVWLLLLLSLATLLFTYIIVWYVLSLSCLGPQDLELEQHHDKQQGSSSTFVLVFVFPSTSSLLSLCYTMHQLSDFTID